MGCDRGIYWREGLKDVFEVWIRGMDLKVGMERSIGRMDWRDGYEAWIRDGLEEWIGWRRLMVRMDYFDGLR